MVVFESWWMFRHHTRIFEQPIYELTPRQLEFVEEVQKRGTKNFQTKPRTKKEEKKATMQGRVDAAIAAAEEKKKHTPLFPTANENEEETNIPEATSVPADTDKSAPPSFF